MGKFFTMPATKPARVLKQMFGNPEACAAFAARIPEEWRTWTDPQQIYPHISTKPFPQRAVNALARPVDPSELAIDANTGLLYLNRAAYVQRLDTAFGAGNWSLMPIGPISVTPSNATLHRPFALIIESKFISEAIGNSLISDFPSPTDAHIWCEYTALVRTCKDIGVASELWDPIASKSLKSKYFERIFEQQDDSNQPKPVWRKKNE